VEHLTERLGIGDDIARSLTNSTGAPTS